MERRILGKEAMHQLKMSQPDFWHLLCEKKLHAYQLGDATPVDVKKLLDDKRFEALLRLAPPGSDEPDLGRLGSADGRFMFQLSRGPMPSADSQMIDDVLNSIFVIETDIDVLRKDGAHVGRLAHSPDFRSFNKDGEVFSLTYIQAQVMKILWDADENGTPEVGQAYIIDQITSGTSLKRLRSAFKDNQRAWEALIEPGGSKGTFRLKM